MRTSKLFSILEHFDKYEQNRCRKYLQSPYFNRDETLVCLFDLLTEDINNGSNGKGLLEKEEIWKRLNPGKSYDDVRFRKYYSDLLKLIEGFLAQGVYEGNPMNQIIFLIKAIGAKKMEKLYNSAMRTARRLSDEQSNRSSVYFYTQYEIEKNYYELAHFDFKRTDRSNIEEIIENLDNFYLAEKLRFLCSALSRQSIASHDYNLKFIDEILSYISKNGFEDIPPIAIYYQIYMTQTQPEEEHYFKLKELLEKYSLQFPPKEGYIIYSYALNYCIRKINQGNEQFLLEYFHLYESGIKNEIIFANGGLSPWDFKNIVILALRLGKYDWTKSFIEEYSAKLPENFRDNAVTFNLARLHWYQKQHDHVIELLREVEYEDVTYNLESKAMLLATYYETDEIEPLYSLLESFRTFLNRHKNIPIQRRKYYKNLIKYTKKLTKILPGDEKSLEKLKKEIEETREFSDRWLNEKIAELE